MDALLAGGAPWPAAVAVSGGGDSIALMHLLAGWAKAARQAPPAVVTVDHGLQQGSAATARAVARWAKQAGLESKVLRWRGPPPASGIEAAAREARYRLMGEWLRGRKLSALYVGHTGDDQAETFLLRLMRGSGLDGLSAMRPVAAWPVPGFAELAVVRPLLGLERGAVRDHLAVRKHAWIEDPMNGEDRFARVRVRKLLPALEDAGLSRARIAAAAGHLARAREALESVTAAVLSRAVRLRDAALHVDIAALTAAPREVGLRALAQLLMLVSGQAYRPRFERLERLFDRLKDGKLGGGATLHGCRLFMAPAGRGAFGAGTLAIVRESGRSDPSPAPHGAQKRRN
ncbi:MAG: tRNA lysidine(34) synthetase TilS [Rhizomicrobium sp.]